MKVLHDKVIERKKSSRSVETPCFQIDPNLIETRSDSLDRRVVEGYACIWGKKNTHLEVFVRGAFAKAISDFNNSKRDEYKIKFRHEHRDTIANIAVLVEDDIGLYFRTVELDPEDEVCDMVLRKLKRGTYNNFSIGFRHVWDKISWDEMSETLYIHEANLLEISVVGVPSDLGTFAIRSEADLLNLKDETEDFIKTLPRTLQLEARSIFSIYQSLIDDNEQLDLKASTLVKNEKQEDRSALIETNEQQSRFELDFDYICKNL